MQLPLAQIDFESSAGQWFWWISWIMLIGVLAILILVFIGVARRWKHRQLKAIDKRRAARRAGRTDGRVDAWAASSERYIDHDKLTEDDKTYGHNKREDDAHQLLDKEESTQDPDEDKDHDPFGLFADKPYQEADDDEDDGFDEDDDFDEGEDWGEDEDDEDKLG